MPIARMKCSTLNEDKHSHWWEDDNYVADEKLDGHWCELVTGNVINQIFSSLGNDISAEHRWLSHTPLPPGFILVGELTVPDGSSNMTLTDVLREKFTGFDMLQVDGVSWIPRPEYVRRTALEKIIQLARQQEGNHRFGIARRVERYRRQFYEEIVNAGGEGVILKDIRAPYLPGKRSPYWRKKKKWLWIDVIVVGCEGKPTMWTVKPGKRGTDGVYYPKGKKSKSAELGYVNLEYGYYINGELVKVGTLGYTGPREMLHHYVGMVAAVKCLNVYTTGALRNATDIVFRNDKAPEECTLEDTIEAAGNSVIKVKGNGADRER